MSGLVEELKQRLQAHRDGAKLCLELLRDAGVKVDDGLLEGVKEIIKERDMYKFHSDEWEKMLAEFYPNFTDVNCPPWDVARDIIKGQISILRP